tara:strand:+ start:196 stop:858 length:663 start_codon:yes stop_codon:yes gene_type:complete
MRNIVIIGSGGHAKVILAEILQFKNKYKFYGFVDSSKRNGSLVIKINSQSYKTVNLEKKKIKNLYGIIGVGDNYKRYKIFEKFSKKFKNIKWETIISKNSVVKPNVKLGEGTIILGNSFIGTGTKINKHCIINTSNSIDHENEFENFSSTGPGVITGGNVKISKFSHLGIGCVVKNNIVIKENVICAGKSYINKNCKKNSIYLGTPSKFERSRTLGEKYL